MEASFSRIVTGSSQLSFSTQLFSQRAGQMRPVKLREVAGLLQHMEGLAPFAFIEQVLPFGLFIA